jgi:adenine-specific DNA-methyltransferase
LNHSAAQLLVTETEQRRLRVSSRINDGQRSRCGQFFTPLSTAAFIGSLPALPESGRVRILDPGAGVGSLTASLVARIVTERPGLAIDVTAVELDATVACELEHTLAGCRSLGASTRLVVGDFLKWGSDAVDTRSLDPDPERFDLIVMNPPYRKVNARTAERRALKRINVDLSNLYVGFLAVAAALLDDGGQLTAITPRSFANGPYFRSFRRYFFDRMSFDRLHVFESRSKVFASDAVLQENIVFSATRRHCAPNDKVLLSASRGDDEPPTWRTVPHSDVVSPDDPDRFVHIVTDDDDAAICHTMSLLATRLGTLGIQVSTGRVVDFRVREYLRNEATQDTVPLLYQGHLREGGICWPGSVRKPTSIVACDATTRQLLPVGTYVLVKRFTAKEERRRVAAAVFDASDIQTDRVGFENHLNVFHSGGRGVSQRLADGLAAWLNSTVVDRFVRSFNGHTQINATDLRRLPYPTEAELLALGEALGYGRTDEQEKIDGLVAAHVEHIVPNSVPSRSRRHSTTLQRKAGELHTM